MATLVYRTIGSAASLGPLVTPTGLTTYVTNQAVAQAEASQSEGTRIELLVPNLGDFAQPAANNLQAKFLTGQFRDPATGTAIIPWPEYPDTIADTPLGQPGTLRVRWVKGEWQIYLVVSLAILVVGYLLIQALHGSPWSMRAANVAGTTSGSGTPLFGGQPFRILYLPWYDAAAIAVVAAATPLVLRQVARTETAEAATLRAHRELRAAESRPS